MDRKDIGTVRFYCHVPPIITSFYTKHPLSPPLPPFPINKVIRGWKKECLLCCHHFLPSGFLWKIRLVFNVKLTLFYRHLIFPDERTHSGVVKCSTLSIGRHPFLGGIKLNVVELSQRWERTRLRGQLWRISIFCIEWIGEGEPSRVNGGVFEET